LASGVRCGIRIPISLLSVYKLKVVHIVGRQRKKSPLIEFRRAKKKANG